MINADNDQDPQDEAFGAKAAADQKVVDDLEEKGVTEDQLPDHPTEPAPRAAGKAPLEPDTSAETLGGGEPTGEAKAAKNREEDPPA